MTSFFQQVFSERNAFWLGFIAGALFLWIFSRLRTYLPALGKLTKRKFISLRESLTTGIEHRYRLDIIRFLQRQHLASPLFSLDEIIIQPKIMVRPIQVAYDNQALAIDTINLTIPYIPDWPELAAIYRTPVCSIFEILQNHANIALAGNPGSGKTVALAYLASQIARKAQITGKLSNCLPVYIHAVDLDFNPDTMEDLSSDADNGDKETERSERARNFIIPILIEAISNQISTITLPRIPSLIQSAFSSGQMVVLLDGLDELPPDRLHLLGKFIKLLIDHFPKIQIIAATSFEHSLALPSYGFHLLALSTWGDSEISEFVFKWHNLWQKLPGQGDQEQQPPNVFQYLKSWLTSGYQPCTPLELTLKVWAAYAGDVLGSDTPSAIEAYLRRVLVNQSKSRDVIERFALQMIISMNPALQPRQTDTIPITNSREVEIIDADPGVKDLLQPQKIKHSQLPADVLSTGMLHSHSDTRFRFASPVLTGYLAGKSLSTYSGLDQILDQPPWSGKSSTLYFFSHFSDASLAAQHLLKHDDFLHSELLRIARWLRVSPKNQPWRSLILRTLVSALDTEKNTMHLAARIIISLATSGDQGVVILFRKMLQSDNPNLRQLAALACGVVKDQQGIDILEKLLHDSAPSIVRSASLALVAIGDKRSLEIIANALVHGSEIMRRAAAEALANHPSEGYPALQEGSTHEDLRVRHAIIFGLLRIKQPWAVEMIDRMQTEDNEWLVRNAAIQAIEDINQPDKYIPKPLPDLTETSWLIDYAAKQGMGVAPGKPAFDLVIEALKHGNAEEKLHALNYLSMFGEVDSIRFIYSWYFGSTGEIRDAAYQTLWSLASAGLQLPSPQMFGFDQ